MIYAYRCATCGAEFTVRATVAEKTRGLDLTCPACGGKESKQDFRGVGVLVAHGRQGDAEGSRAPRCRPGAGCC